MPPCLSVEFFLAYFATLLVHELGHLFAALLVGFKPHAVVFGTGREIIVLFPNDLPIRIRALPTGGFVLVHLKGVRWMQLRSACFYIAGPVANVATALGVLGVPFVTLWLSDAPVFVTSFVVSNAVIAILSLAPGKIDASVLGFPAGAGYFLTDGQGFMSSILGEKIPQIADVPARMEPGKSWSSPNTSTGSTPKAHASYSGSKPPPRCRDPEKIDSYVTALISGSQRDPLHDAEEMARELVRLTNNAVTSRGTLGSVLTLRNKSEGIRILRQVYEESGSDNDRFFSAAFLAYYFATHHNPGASARWFLRAQQFGNVPARLPWIARTVKKARPRLSRLRTGRRGHRHQVHCRLHQAR